MNSFFKIQETIRASNQRSSPLVVEAGPFTCFLHPTDPAHYANYAMPNRLLPDVQPEEILALVEVFNRHDRRPRLEFIAPCAPTLEQSLHAFGFTTDSKTVLMVCTSATLRQPPAIPGLVCIPLGPESSLEDYRQYFTVQVRAFGSDPEPEAPLAAEEFRNRFGHMYKLLARLHGHPAGIGMVTFPTNGAAEVAGIGTLPTYRRHGIAGMVTYLLSKHSLDNGLDTLFLTAADEAAGRVYERVGFVPTGAHQINISLP